ncbi:hypothetical protein ABC337_05095 [Arthrobacter sp. 1P04PC]|uniref:hypothetical protein n=1 Tax=unclassified Arthrobacter TaxID=235627 RepID=UPI0039A349F7
MEKNEQVGELTDGLVQLRFSDEAGTIHDLNAAEMAEALQGLVELNAQMAKAGLYGEGAHPEIRVRPPEKGSFIIEAVVQWAAANPEGAVSISGSAGAALTWAIGTGVKLVRGDVVDDFDYLDNGNVKVKFKNGSPEEVPRKVWEELNTKKRRTRKTLSKIMAPLGDDADLLEVRDGDATETTSQIMGAAPDLVVGRDDYRAAVREIDDVEERESDFEAEAQLRAIDFRRGEKWTVKTLHGTRKAKIEDEEFLLQLDRGLALHKNDIFDVTIHEVITTKNGRNSTQWSLTKVSRKRRGADDDNQDSSPQEPDSPEPAPED